MQRAAAISVENMAEISRNSPSQERENEFQGINGSAL
jgi:hypothetical protein